MSVVTFRTRTGKSVEMKAYAPSTNWRNVGAIYAFGYMVQNQWRILYIGQTEDLKLRMASHERWKEAASNGATHILAAVVTDRNSRETLERELIEHYAPSMNSMFV